jgi:hypothetical protein
MAEIKIIWDGAVIEEIMHGPNGPIGRYMFERAEIVKQGAIRQCNKRTTLLSKSILKRPVVATVGGMDVIVGAYQPYAVYVHEGTVSHNIPNAFGWGPTFGIGGRFPMGVKGAAAGAWSADNAFHPGYKGNPFLSDNLKLFFA